MQGSKGNIEKLEACPHSTWAETWPSQGRWRFSPANAGEEGLAWGYVKTK